MKRVKKEKPALEDPFMIVRSGNPRQMQAYLEERGIGANKCRGGSGWSLLHRAAEQGQIEICEVLLHFGAKIDDRTARK
jgi:ankyrin repeat protein